MAAEVYTPTVTFTVTPERQVSGPEYMLEYRQSQRLSVAASVPDAPVTVEGYEDLDGTDTWVWRRYRSGITSSDGSFSADLPNLPEGTLLRAVVEASADGLRRRAVSEEVATTLTPIPLALDGPQVDVFDVTRDRGSLAVLQATAGDLITFDFGDAYTLAGGRVTGRLYGPDGQEVPEQRFVRGLYDGQYVSRYFRPTTTGTHTLVLTALEDRPSSDVRIAASTPMVVPVSVDVQTRVRTWRPQQVIDLEFTGAAGQGISVLPGDSGRSCRTTQLYRGDQLMPRRFAEMVTANEMQSVWELPVDGSYRLRLWPCDDTPLDHTLTVVSAEEVWLEFNKDTRIDLSRSNAYGVASFATTAGKHIQLEMVDWYYPGHQAVVSAPDGSLLPTDFIAPQAGTYRLWVSPGSGSSSYAVWRATETGH